MNLFSSEKQHIILPNAELIYVTEFFNSQEADNYYRIIKDQTNWQHDDITVFGDGTQTRSFQYVDDLIEGTCRMMNSRDEFIGPVNIGNPNEFTMLQLANEVIDLTGSKSKIVFLTLPMDDPMQRRPDINLARQELNGWEPKIQLRDGLKLTIDYFDDLLKEIN